MEKATLIVTKSKKGKLIFRVKFDVGEPMTAPKSDKYKESMNNEEIQVERKNGQIKKIEKDGNVLFEASSFQPPKKQYQKPKYKDQRNQRQSQGDQKPKTNNYGPATAPYNFIHLNESVIESEISDFSKFAGLNGYIDINVETITPMYIRDTFTLEEIEKAIKGKKIKDLARLHPDFFSPAGQIRIPGSSMRGMIRNLVSIVSWSKFQNFDDESLFFRGVADQSNVSSLYDGRMIDRQAEEQNKKEMNQDKSVRSIS